MALYRAQFGAFRNGCMNFHNKLISEYHAEVSDEDKARILEEFRKPDSVIRCLISTVAFGIGIDIPDIRLVMHWGESDTVSQYWQEVGRAGRDGQPAEAHLFHRQIQLLQCAKDMKDAVTEITGGACLRKTILKNLQVDGMTAIDEGVSVFCCSICAEKAV